MALPWHIPLEAAPGVREIKEYVPETSLLQHYCKMNIHEHSSEELQVGIMCDIGQENKDVSVIQRLIAASMTVARLSIRDQDPDVSTQIIQSIRQAVYNYSAELEYVYPLAILVDVRGPSIITGDLKGGPRTTIELLRPNTIRLTTDLSWRECGTVDNLYVGYDNLTDLQPGDNIFITSLTPDQIQLVVKEVGDDSVECFIEAGGTIGAKMAVRIVHVPHDLASLNLEKGDSDSILCSDSSEKSFEHIEDQVAWAIGSDVDGVIVPNTQNIHDVRQVRDLLAQKAKHILVFACIETMLAFDNIDEILTAADGIYIDRSILSIDVPVEKVFIAQKIIMAKCNLIGKPCICKAVINEQIPTLCVTDIANLVLDGVDVISLEIHYDSPLKKFAPSYDAVRMAEHCLAAAAVICRNAESIIWQPQVYGNIHLMQKRLEEPTKAICVSAVELSLRSNAQAIICMTNSGRTAKVLSHAKPLCPIIAVTRCCHTARQLRFWRGVRAMHYFDEVKGDWLKESDCRIHAALDYCKAKRILRAGDAYVILTSSRRGVGYCDAVRLLYASARDTVLVE